MVCGGQGKQWRSRKRNKLYPSLSRLCLTGGTTTDLETELQHRGTLLAERDANVFKDELKKKKNWLQFL